MADRLVQEPGESHRAWCDRAFDSARARMEALYADALDELLARGHRVSDFLGTAGPA